MERRAVHNETVITLKLSSYLSSSFRSPDAGKNGEMGLLVSGIARRVWHM
jgi:hypothetical protein